MRATIPSRGCRPQPAKGLAKTYIDRGWFGKPRIVHAAADVAFEIRRGQTLGIVGESGSGKSTVARCVLRLIDPTAGHIKLGSADIALMPHARLRPLRKRVQIVFQDPYRSLDPRRAAACLHAGAVQCRPGARFQLRHRRGRDGCLPRTRPRRWSNALASVFAPATAPAPRLQRLRRPILRLHPMA